jgi:hypothetical protein
MGHQESHRQSCIKLPTKYNLNEEAVHIIILNY